MTNALLFWRESMLWHTQIVIHIHRRLSLSHNCQTNAVEVVVSHNVRSFLNRLNKICAGNVHRTTAVFVRIHHPYRMEQSSEYHVYNISDSWGICAAFTMLQKQIFFILVFVKKSRYVSRVCEGEYTFQQCNSKNLVPLS